MPTLAEVLRQTGYSQDGTLAAPATDSPMTKALSEHIKGLPQQFAANQNQQMNLLNQAFPGNTYESMMTQGDPKAMAELAMQVPFNALTAFHGTPHKIVGKFDINKVGTGEGAQAYGHGMYFAENPKVANEYSKMLPAGGSQPSPRRMLGDVEVEPLTAEYKAAQLVEEMGLSKAKKFVSNWVKDPTPDQAEFAQNVQNAILGVTKKSDVKNLGTGNLYKVDIPDEYIPNMLDWDKPLSKMTEKETAIIEPLKQKLMASKNPYHPKSFETIGQVIQFSRGSNPNLEKQLMQAGIPGIKYLDEGSRDAGKGTRNFVVFDPSTVKILEENSKPVSRKGIIEKQVKALKD